MYQWEQNQLLSKTLLQSSSHLQLYIDHVSVMTDKKRQPKLIGKPKAKGKLNKQIGPWAKI